MAFVCSDCVTWVNSRDANRYGEKWCDYDRKYRAADQNIYGCRGFVWARRSIITKVCEILGINGQEYFDSFDREKEIYLIPGRIDKLIDYNTVGPVISKRLDSDPNKEQIARNLLEHYIRPASELVKSEKNQEALSLYERMVKMLAVLYEATKENIMEENMYNNLISSRSY